MHDTHYKCKFGKRIAVFSGFPPLTFQRRRPPLALKPIAAAFATALAACGGDPSPREGESGGEPLRVVVRTTPAAWYLDDGTAKGVDHDLLSLFAETLGRDLEISHAPNTAAALAALCQPQAQLAVGLLSLSAPIKEQFRTGRDYGTMKQQLLYHFNQPRPTDNGELLMKNIEVGDEPAQLKTLLDIKQHNGDLTHWTLHRNSFPHELIESVDQGLIDYTIADSHAVTMTRRFHSRIKEAFDVGDKMPLHWVFGDCADAGLVEAADAFFADIEAERKLTQIFDRYDGHVRQLDYPEKLTFIENVDRHLGRYRELFIEAAAKTGMDWLLLAAVSYQESHWDPRARSPSGVEGLMMVTLETAREFGIEDRRDPAQSIHAGTRFLLKLKDRLPPELHEPDRSWFALAAYNAGLGHVKKAMATARRQGNDPLRWVEVRDFLRTPGGRKQEGTRSLNNPYVYVYNVRAYRDLLAWLEGVIRFAPFEETPRRLAVPPSPLPM